MITEELVAYLRSQLKKNIPKYITVFRLTQAGWHPQDIEEGYARAAQVAQQPQLSVVQAQPIVQPVQPVAQPIVAEQNPAPIREEPKVWTPSISAPIQTAPAVQVQPQSAPAVAPTEYIPPEKPAPKLEFTKNPMVEHAAYIPPLELMPEGLEAALGQNTPAQNNPAPVSRPLTPAQAPAPVVKTPPPVQAPVTPPVIKTPPIQPVQQQAMPAISSIEQRKQALASSVSSILRPEPQVMSPVDQAEALRQAQVRSQKAMLTSYTQDVISANEERTHPSRTHSSMKMPKVSKKAWIAIVVILLLAGGIFAFASGLISFPAFSFVKKDPQDAILNGAAGFSGLKSYKSDISASITIPSFATITSGLVTGDSVNSVDLESLSINATGQISQGVISPKVSSFSGMITSSLLKDPIASTWRYDGDTSYIDVPVLSELLGDYAPPATTVAVQSGQFGLLLPELPQDIQDTVKKADIYNVVSNGVPPYAQTEVIKTFTQFISNVTASDKGEEDIHGAATYHYSLEASRPVTKQFLSDLLNTFVISLSGDMKQNVDAALGAVTLDSFDVWVGKDDNLVHQYSFTFTAPLSKVIALDDKGIAGKEVSLNFKDTFYDFNVPNSVTMPLNATPMVDFIKSIRDTKIKAIIDSFNTAAHNLSNAEGGYGKIANASGSCSAPTPGSLFSPLGHSNGASAQVSAIASTMNNLLEATNGGGFCYSSPKAWSLAAPLSSDHTSYYCNDSSGSSATLSAVPGGVACK
jgi:hypothetical protein